MAQLGEKIGLLRAVGLPEGLLKEHWSRGRRFLKGQGLVITNSNPKMEGKCRTEGGTLRRRVWYRQKNRFGPVATCTRQTLSRVRVRKSWNLPNRPLDFRWFSPQDFAFVWGGQRCHGAGEEFPKCLFACESMLRRVNHQVNVQMGTIFSQKECSPTCTLNWVVGYASHRSSNMPFRYATYVANK